MLYVEQRFNFGNEIQKAYLIDATDAESVKVNKTDAFQRIPLQEIDLKSLNLPFEKITKFGWITTKPLSSCKHKVTYNQIDYFMTYLDELDLFKTVVQKQ
jgi:hypothetical protein